MERVPGTRVSLTGIGAAAAFALAALTPAASAAPPASAAGCAGVHVLTTPYLAIGIGPVTTSITGGLGGPPICIPIGSQRQNLSVGSPARSSAKASRSAGCRGSGKPAYKLRGRVASAAVRCLINKRRSKRGLKPLKAREPLKKAAKKHTKLMVRSGCFSHRCSSEPDLIGRVTRTGYLPCNCGWSVSETLAWGRGRKSAPKRIVKAWMKSAPHRSILLTGAFRDVDVGVKRGKPGKAKARAATFTANFGYRR